MNAIKKFEKHFDSEIIDMLVLTKADVNGAAVVGNMLRPSVAFLASVNMQTGEFSRETGQLQWMISREKNKTGWGFDFKQFQIYHIRVRKNKPISNMSHIKNNCYMVVEVLEENVSEPRLDAVKEHVMKPICIKDSVLGTFEFDRELSWFAGTVDWLGRVCEIFLETDEEDGETAQKAYVHLQKLYENVKEWDEKLCQFAAQNLLEQANEWCEYSEEKDGNEMHITKEEFISRISIGSVVISAEGDLTLYYDADGMFTDHSIEIDADMSGEISDAYIVG